MRKTTVVDFHCSGCNLDGQLDIGTLTKAELEKYLDRDGGFECHVGHHHETGKRKEFWTLNWDSKRESMEMDDEECKADLQKKGNILYTPEQMSEEFILISMERGVCIAQERITGLELEFQYDTLPSGTRIFFR